MTALLYCPLCGDTGASAYHCDRRRAYHQCGRCALVFVPPSFYLSAARERAEYDLHHNHPEDPGYRRFLSRLASPLIAALPRGARGLDFGCGPGPALAQMLAEAGFEVCLFDYFYQPHWQRLAASYDFICATEVVEHLHRPGAELQRLWSLLRPGGLLAVMTKLVLNPQAFAAWHYKNDPTHVCFFSRDSWQWWASMNAAQLSFAADDVIFLRKPK